IRTTTQGSDGPPPRAPRCVCRGPRRDERGRVGVSGSVYKRCSKCSIRMRARACGRCGGTNFRWAFVIDLGRDTAGRRLQRQRSGFATKADAERALHEVQASLMRGRVVERSKATVAEFLFE